MTGPDPKFHHVAKRILPNSLEKVIEVFGLFGMRVTYRPEQHRWAMLGQEGTALDIQLSEVENPTTKISERLRSHIGFLSQDPAAQIAKVESWASENNLKFEKGGWNEKELWFDLPELFVDWVVEIMHNSVVEGVKE